ncbi:intradiol ring-cleavage dioxygenase [Pseudoduganella umbonata]|uniref:Intradiol ring-cleavage dioxygenase n=1 Tax=Pseudoduganella umbonata TaxID=864828 RepID=A0A4V1ED70_9BURK|nr:intradiol ring-cleavage dioxygenase [Pseudoduganella umbonata]MBB3220045.1 protocatechuate 3,4-dioxygenase beta subunit [Pseudoduganella umbonata]QCP10051.1 intradiol ring-cleavage dioxygenase [Pseudoduganella umbonata]
MAYHGHSLEEDLQTMLNTTAGRRQSLRWLLAGAASLPILGCGGSSDTAASTTDTGTGTSATGTTSTGTTTNTGGGSTGTATTTSSSCSVIPEETGGPYPADGTNSNSGGVVNVLAQSGVVRSDIRSSFGGMSGTAAGVPLTIRLHIVNANNSCAAASGFAVYLWHCDRDGNYSLYSSGVTNQNYLRGVQEADANGDITFATIFPGCYAGRMPHVHFEVYATLAKASSASNRIKTSQFAFPTDICNHVYATTGYSASVRNLAQISFATDNIFSDGYSLQLATLTGNATDGYVATLTVAVVA